MAPTFAGAIPIPGSVLAQKQFQGNAVQDIAALKAVGPSDRFDKQERTVEGPPLEQYFFDAQSAAASSEPDILVPDDSPANGRWFRLKPSGGVPAAHSLGGAEHTADTLANLNSKVSDATLIDTGDARLSDARTPTSHSLGGAEHAADTLANLNAKITGATLVDSASIVLTSGVNALTGDWGVGGFQITGLGGLDPNTDLVRHIGTVTLTWGRLYCRDFYNQDDAQMFSLDPGVMIINDQAADIDFRVEGVSDSNLLRTAAGTNRVGVGINVPLSKLDVRGGILGQYDVEAVASSPRTLIAGESRRVFTNEAATVQFVHNLPTASAGLTYTFVVQDADGSRVNAATGDTLRIGGTVSAAAGRIEGGTIGDTITMVAINATEWIGISREGSWTVDGGTVAGWIHSDGSVPLTAGWAVGDVIISGIGRLDPAATGARDIGTGSLTWRTGFFRTISTDSGNTLSLTVTGATQSIIIGGTITTFNEAGGDNDHRLEGLSDINLMTWDAGLDRVGIGVALTTHNAKFHVSQTANARAFCLESSATSAATVFNIIANSITSGFIIDCDDADGLTTGSIQRMISDSASTGTRTLLQFTNDNVLATGATVLGLQQDAAQRALFIDHNGATGEAIEIDRDSNDAGDIYAVKIVSDNAGAGLPGGIDMSAFAADEPLLSVPVDTTAEGAYYGRVAVNVVGVGTRYISLQVA